MGYYQKFLTGLKKQMQGTKSGEAGFKAGNDGCFLNGNATIAESFKMMEDAIALSGANDDGRKVF
jgi:enolase